MGIEGSRDFKLTVLVKEDAEKGALPNHGQRWEAKIGNVLSQCYRELILASPVNGVEELPALQELECLMISVSEGFKAHHSCLP
jgi:hypothetical protein